MNAAIISESTQPVNLNTNAATSTGENIRCPKLKGFTIAHLNIRSLIKHIDESRLYFEEQQFEIIGIKETMLDQSIPDHEIHITRYDVLGKTEIG